MVNDYTVQVLAEQRRQDFAAEAANDRLVRLATTDRPSPWHRLLRAVPQLTPALSARHRVAS